jgi:hypothetical protein
MCGLKGGKLQEVEESCIVRGLSLGTFSLNIIQGVKVRGSCSTNGRFLKIRKIFVFRKSAWKKSLTRHLCGCEGDI